MICTDGHQNQAGGCCCPIHGNTCGFHPEYDKSLAPAGYVTLAEYLNDQPDKDTGPGEDDSLDALKEKYPHLPM